MNIKDVLTKLFNNEIKVEDADEEIGERLRVARHERFAKWFHKTFDEPGDLGLAALAVMGLALAACLVFVACYAMIGGARSTGAADYCVISGDIFYGSTTVKTEKSHLYAHRPWRDDVRVGQFNTFDEAASAAQRMNCPLKKR